MVTPLDSSPEALDPNVLVQINLPCARLNRAHSGPPIEAVVALAHPTSTDDRQEMKGAVQSSPLTEAVVLLVTVANLLPNLSTRT